MLPYHSWSSWFSSENEETSSLTTLNDLVELSKKTDAIRGHPNSRLAPLQPEVRKSAGVIKKLGSQTLTGDSFFGSTIDDFINIGKLLDTGQFGCIYACTLNQATQEMGALCVKRASKLLCQEMDVLDVSDLSHEHVVEICVRFEDPDWYYLVMPYYDGGCLLNHTIARIDHQNSWTEGIGFAHLCGQQIFSAMAYLHSQSIVHGDLKLSNFVFESPVSLRLRLIDIGFMLKKEARRMGSVGMTAPEVLLVPGAGVSPLSDVFCGGVMLFEMAVGYSPFSSVSSLNGYKFELQQFKARGLVAYLEAMNDERLDRFRRLPTQLRSLLIGTMAPKPDHRLSSTAARDSQFFRTPGSAF